MMCYHKYHQYGRLALLLTLICLLHFLSVDAFIAVKPAQVQVLHSKTNYATKTTMMLPQSTPWKTPSNHQNDSKRLVILHADKEPEEDSSLDNFDAQGFSGYLAPYAIAVLASFVVTGAFVKFVLLDY